jgi:hypothetical protein
VPKKFINNNKKTPIAEFINNLKIHLRGVNITLPRSTIRKRANIEAMAIST